MPDHSIEVLSARERRRRWSAEEKLRIVAECEEPGAILRAVAARHDVYPTLLGSWRRQVRRGQLVAAQKPELVPIRIAEASAPIVEALPPSNAVEVSGVISIILPDGCRVSVGNDVTLATLRRVMTVLRG